MFELMIYYSISMAISSAFLGFILINLAEYFGEKILNSKSQKLL